MYILQTTPTKGLETLLGVLPLNLFAQREASTARLHVCSLVVISNPKQECLGLGHQIGQGTCLKDMVIKKVFGGLDTVTGFPAETFAITHACEWAFQF